MKLINIFLIPAILAGTLIILYAKGAERQQEKTASYISSVCANIENKYDRIIESARGACRTNADCGCYNPVSRKSGCGGVTDKPSADLLKKLDKEFHRAKCRYHLQCAAWFCSPACINGRCMRG